MLIDCPECGGRVSTFATSCPHCGYPLAQHSTPQAAASPPQARPAQAQVALKNGGTLRFHRKSSGSNDVYDDEYTFEFRRGRLWVYVGDHDVADYTEIKFNGRTILDALEGPGTSRESFTPLPAAVEWADALLEAAGLPPGRSSFSRYCYETFSAPGPTCARIYDQQ